PGSPGAPDSVTARARRAPRAHRAPGPAGQGDRPRAQHEAAGRRRCTGRDRSGREGDRTACGRPCPVWTWTFTGCNPGSCESGIRQVVTDARIGRLADLIVDYSLELQPRQVFHID